MGSLVDCHSVILLPGMLSPVDRSIEYNTVSHSNGHCMTPLMRQQKGTKIEEPTQIGQRSVGKVLAKV